MKYPGNKDASRKIDRDPTPEREESSVVELTESRMHELKSFVLGATRDKSKKVFGLDHAALSSMSGAEWREKFHTARFFAIMRDGQIVGVYMAERRTDEKGVSTVDVYSVAVSQGNDLHSVHQMIMDTMYREYADGRTGVIRMHVKSNDDAARNLFEVAGFSVAHIGDTSEGSNEIVMEKRLD